MFVITGGGSGIGRALAHVLADCQKQVLIVGRREACLQEVQQYSPLITYCVADLATTTGQEQLVQSLKTVSHLEGLIHNAAIIEPIVLLQHIDHDAWRMAIETNLNAPLFLTQKLYSKLSHARVLHIGSGVAHFAVQGWGAYCVSKAALYMLTQCLQLESQDIAFTSVMPGIIDTDMQALIRSAAAMDQDKLNFFKGLKDSNRLIRPEIVAWFLKWLLLDLDKDRYVSKEWDIYDSSHHASWLKAGLSVPRLEE